jgi:hypothetical protein
MCALYDKVQLNAGPFFIYLFVELMLVYYMSIFSFSFVQRSIIHDIHVVRLQ